MHVPAFLTRFRRRRQSHPALAWMTQDELTADLANSARIEHEADFLDELTTFLGMQYVMLADAKDTTSYREGKLPALDLLRGHLDTIALRISEFDTAEVRHTVGVMVDSEHDIVAHCGREWADALYHHDRGCELNCKAAAEDEAWYPRPLPANLSDADIAALIRSTEN